MISLVDTVPIRYRHTVQGHECFWVGKHTGTGKTTWLLIARFCSYDDAVWFVDNMPRDRRKQDGHHEICISMERITED